MQHISFVLLVQLESCRRDRVANMRGCTRFPLLLCHTRLCQPLREERCSLDPSSALICSIKVEWFVCVKAVVVVFVSRGERGSTLRMESSLSDGRIISGQLFTAFDEETKGTSSLAPLSSWTGYSRAGGEPLASHRTCWTHIEGLIWS